MNTVLVFGLSACSGASCQPVAVSTVQPAQVVVIEQQRPLLGILKPRPQYVVLQPVQSAPNCQGGKCK